MKLIVSFLFCFILLSAATDAQDNVQNDERLLDIQTVTSPGGISAWLVEDHSLPIIALQFSFKGAGAAGDPPDRQGLARLASNTMDEGAGPYDSQSFQKTLTDLNISLGFSANRDNFGGSVKTLVKHRDKAFELLRLALNEPRFDEEPVERMRAANLARIRNSLASPEWKAARLLNATAFEGHPYAKNSGGTLTTMQAITIADLRAFATGRLGRDNLVIGVTGAISATELAPLLDEVFGPLPARSSVPAVPATTVRNPGTTVLYEQDMPQTIIRGIQPGIGRGHPDYYTGMVMNFILGSSGFGSRLMEEIREKRGLTYGIYSAFMDMEHLDALTVSTATKNESVGEMLGLIRQEWQRLIETPVTIEELDKAQSYLVGSLPLSLSSTGSIAGILLGLQLDDMPVDYLDRRADHINAVTAADIQDLAARLLAPEALTFILVGQPEGVSPNTIVETLPDVE